MLIKKIKPTLFYRCFFIVFFGFVPFFSVSAQVLISEIMYDLDGSDTDREWVEIFNSGGEIDLTGWKFDDGDSSKHGLNLPPKNGGQGSFILSAGAYAILADNASTFLSEHAGFSAIVIDTLVSLSNTGEIIAILNKEGVISDSVNYASDWGAKGDGNSLQKIGDKWLVGAPTPGAENAESQTLSAPSSFPDEVSSDGSIGSQSSSVGSDSSLSKQTIFPNAGPDRNVIAGASIVFEGEALGIKKEALLNARYVWNFGDGETAEGKKVIHTYRYPGEHVVVLNVASGERSVSDKAVVIVTESKMSISGILSGQDGYVEILNGSSKEADISWWQIGDGVKTFVIPSETVILPSKKIRFANSVTKLAPSEENLTFYYPSGKVAYRYSNSKLSLVAPTLTPTYSERKTVTAGVGAIKKSVEEEYSGFKNNQEAASAAEAAFPSAEKFGNWKWYLALFGLIALALGGVIFVAKNKKDESGFTIVE